MLVAHPQRTKQLRRPRNRTIIPVGLLPELADALRSISQARDIPQSVLIRQAIDRLVREARQDQE